MKKRVSVILLTLSMFCLASCGISEAPNNIVSTPKPTATTPAVKEEFATTETTPEPTHNLTAAELFATVLRDEKSIYFSELGYNRQTELPPSKTGTISELQFGYENHYNIANFAVVDLDGNRIPEVILEVEEYFGYIILSCQDGRITGNGMYYRGFCDLKKDGLYFSTSGAAYGQINRLYFMGDTWESPRGNHVGPQGKSRGPPGEITWAPRGNHVGPQEKSRGPPGEITWTPRGNHVGPTGKSDGPHGEITWAPG